MEKTNLLSLASQIFEKLETGILTGEYKKGEILTESKLSEQFGVSRTPVHEAIKRLQQENLVIETFKGHEIVGITEKDLSDIYEIRMRIEGLATRWAAEKITDEQLKELLEVIELQEFYFSKSSLSQLNNTDSHFHELIYTYCGSQTLMTTLKAYLNKVRVYRKLSMERPERAVCTVKEHIAIYKALSEHNADEAERLAVIHVKNAKESIAKQFVNTGE